MMPPTRVGPGESQGREDPKQIGRSGAQDGWFITFLGPVVLPGNGRRRNCNHVVVMPFTRCRPIDLDHGETAFPPDEISLTRRSTDKLCAGSTLPLVLLRSADRG